MDKRCEVCWERAKQLAPNSAKSVEQVYAELVEVMRIEGLPHHDGVPC